MQSDLASVDSGCTIGRCGPQAPAGCGGTLASASAAGFHSAAAASAHLAIGQAPCIGRQCPEATWALKLARAFAAASPLPPAIDISRANAAESSRRESRGGAGDGVRGDCSISPATVVAGSEGAGGDDGRSLVLLSSLKNREADTSVRVHADTSVRFRSGHLCPLGTFSALRRTPRFQLERYTRFVCQDDMPLFYLACIS